jgi:hypothetical protein
MSHDWASASWIVQSAIVNWTALEVEESLPELLEHVRVANGLLAGVPSA